MANFKTQPMTHKSLMCYHYKFVVISKLQAFLLQNNLCFTKNSHILQNLKLKIIGHTGKKQGWDRPIKTNVTSQQKHK